MPDYGQNITWESYPDYDSWGAADALLGVGALGTSALKGLGWFGRNAGWVVPTVLIGAGVVYALKIRKLIK